MTNVIFLSDFRKAYEGTNLMPMDFYRFKHRTWMTTTTDGKPRWQAPCWVVGHSPFDSHMSAEEGHVVHTAAPRFVARWRYDAECDAGDGSYLDEDLALLIHEVTWLDAPPAEERPWLLEAAFARGEIAESLPDQGLHILP